MRRSLFRPVAVLAMAGGLVVGTALPALAHHPILSGARSCNSGKQIITWTVKNSESSAKVDDRLQASRSPPVPCPDC